MKQYFKMSHIGFLTLIIGITVFVSIAFAAVQLSITQQNIKTLRAILTYQDVIAAPSIGGDSNLRLLKIVDVPANVEILSAYFRINTSFTDASLNNLFIDGEFGVYNENSLEFPISQGNLYDIGLRKPNIISGLSEIVISDQPRELKFYVNDTDYNGSINNLTSGALEVHINYLVH